MEKKEKPKIFTIIMVILMLWVLANIMSFFLAPASGTLYLLEGNVALIKIDGMIMTEDPDSLFGTPVSSSSEIVEFIKIASKNDNIDAILFEINSPGGSAVASSEIAKAIKEANKTTVSYIREIGTSGAYWAASATDYIVANQLAFTGSIGVISSYLEFSDLMDKYGITYQRLVAGKYKDVGSPYRNLTQEETDMLQEKLDTVHDFFISKVAENRHMDESEIREIATGMFYLGTEAKELGLVDKLGDMEDAKDYIKDKLELEEIHLAEYKKEQSFFSMISASLDKNFFFLGKGLASGSVSQGSLIRT